MFYVYDILFWLGFRFLFPLPTIIIFWDSYLKHEKLRQKNNFELILTIISDNKYTKLKLYQ